MVLKELNVLVLQGGGALGSYQAGAYQSLHEYGLEVDWVAGISIGAINAALICGNPAGRRVERLSAFWEGVSAAIPGTPWPMHGAARKLFSEAAATGVMATGVPGFFVPRPPVTFWPFVPAPALSFYDTSPLEKTLGELVDFDYLNDRGPRLSVGAVDVETGNFVYFDSRKERIDARHIMASGALPPGFPPVEIDGRHYWDGGLVSNTPLYFVMEQSGTEPLCIFQVDLFSARGALPHDLWDAQHREKDIRFSSRTRMITDWFKGFEVIREAADRLAAKLPPALRDDPDLTLLREVGPDCGVTIAHIIHRTAKYQSGSKDYEFSRPSMRENWAAGMRDMGMTLTHPAWTARQVRAGGMQVFDLARDAAGSG